MDRERRQRVEELFHAALDREPGLRKAWLRETCGSDESLRREIEELLSHAGRAEGFLEKPAVDVAARQFAAPQELTAGQSVDRYRIVSRLGAGGMGTVYSARDSKLGRTVALKFLQEEFTGDEGRMERFRREARTLSALNHPNICTVYDIAEADGRTFISMEYVPGKTLEVRIGRKGMKLADVLKYGAQIADGMAKAHDAGIVHRDLKPTNIIITEEGQAKLLDFGIAKLTAPSDGAEDQSTATLSLAGKAHTEEGAIVGTLAYLSPEQAEGKTIDPRSDIFSFGAVLYEMITGIKAFRRESRSSTVWAILNEEPKPLRELAPDVHPELEKIVARCLRKDPERRLRSMADLGLALRELKEDSESGRLMAAAPALKPRNARKNWLWVAAGVTAAAVAGGSLTWWMLSRQSPPPSIKTVPLTTYPGVEKDPSLSPDGTQVAFAWNGEKKDNFDIYVKAIGPGPPLRLTNDPAEDVSPAWSPDGSTIAFLRNRGVGKYSVLVIPALGGVERKLADVSIENRAWVSGPFISWTSDSQSLVVIDQPVGSRPSALFLISLRSQERKQLTFPPPGIIGDGCAAVSPDGGALAFCRHGAFGEFSYNVYSVALGPDSMPRGSPRQLTFKRTYIEGLAWTPDSRSIVYSTGALWMVPVSSLAVAAQKETQLHVAGTWPTLARHSPRLVCTWSNGGGLDVWRLRIPRSGAKAEPPARLIASTKNEFAQQYSPDGKRIAFESNRSGNLEIWACDSEGGNCTQLTSLGAQFTGVPTWSPDGRQIAFYSQVEGKSQVFLVGAEGGATRRLTDGHYNDFYARWSRSGAWVYFASNRTGRYEIWKIPSGGGNAVQVTRNGGFAASESTDGKWLFYTKNQNSDSGLWKMPLAGGGETQLLPSVVLHNYAVMDDGVYFIVKSGNDYGIQFLSNTTGRTQIVAPVHAGYVGFSISPDRKWILYTENNPASGELVLVESLR